MAAVIDLTAAESGELESLSRCRTGKGLAHRARIVLLAAELANRVIARRVAGVESTVANSGVDLRRTASMDSTTSLGPAALARSAMMRGSPGIGDDPEGCHVLVVALNGSRGRSRAIVGPSLHDAARARAGLVCR